MPLKWIIEASYSILQTFNARANNISLWMKIQTFASPFGISNFWRTWHFMKNFYPFSVIKCVAMIDDFIDNISNIKLLSTMPITVFKVLKLFYCDFSMQWTLQLWNQQVFNSQRVLIKFYVMKIFQKAFFADVYCDTSRNENPFILSWPLYQLTPSYSSSFSRKCFNPLSLFPRTRY